MRPLPCCCCLPTPVSTAGHLPRPAWAAGRCSARPLGAACLTPLCPSPLPAGTQVTCPDRHGLLADVVRALRELPLEITTAAITTRRDNVVYDVFQVSASPVGWRLAGLCDWRLCGWLAISGALLAPRRRPAGAPPAPRQLAILSSHLPAAFLPFHPAGRGGGPWAAA